MDNDPPATGMLMLVCPISGAEIETHALYSIDDLQRAHAVRLLHYCPGCKEEHVFNFSDGRLRPRQAGEGENGRSSRR